MRRMVAILAFALVWLRPGPAAAHVCTNPVQVAVREPATVTLGIGAEVAAVTEVEVGVPEGFRVTEASGEGWQSEVAGDTVRFTGGTIDPFACGFLTLRGVADEQAELVLPLELTTADGASVVHDREQPYREDSALLIYAGVPLPGLPRSDGGGGTDPLMVAGWGLIAVGVLAGGVWAVVRRRSDGPEPGGGPDRQKEHELPGGS